MLMSLDFCHSVFIPKVCKAKYYAHKYHNHVKVTANKDEIIHNPKR